jgi:ATP-dependent Lon protease
MQLLKLPDGTVRVLVEGAKRARLVDLVDRDGFVAAEIEEVAEEAADGPEAQALMRSVVEQFENYAKLNKRLPPETGIQLAEIEDPSVLADAVASNLSIKVADKQALLGELNPARRMEMVFAFMEGELGVLQVEKKIRSRVKRQMEKTQREYYLNEQLKAIQRELGNESEEGGDELQELAAKIRKTKLSKEARTRANAELKKLKAMAPMSAEATVARNYLDVLLGLPWGKKAKVKKDIAEAQRVLDEDHYGLEKVKDRIVEYLAVQARTNKLKGPILCLVGPARRRQDVARSLDRQGHRARVRSPVAWRGSRRGGDSRAPPDLYRLASGQDRLEHP